MDSLPLIGSHQGISSQKDTRNTEPNQSEFDIISQKDFKQNLNNQNKKIEAPSVLATINDSYEQQEQYNQFLNKVPIQVIANSIKKNKYSLSNLSTTKYESLLSDRTMQHSPILGLPSIVKTDRRKLVHEYDEQNIITQPMDFKKQYPFISFNMIQKLNEKLGTEYQYSVISDHQKQQKAISQTVSLMSPNGSTNSSFMFQNSFSIGRAKSIASNQDYLSLLDTKKTGNNISNNQSINLNLSSTSKYSPRDMIQFELAHNQFQSNHLSKFNEQQNLNGIMKIEEIVNNKNNILQKMPHVRKIMKGNDILNSIQQMLDQTQQEDPIQAQQFDNNNPRETDDFVNKQSTQFYQAFWQENSLNLWKPEPRMYFGLGKIENNVYIYGGLGSRTLNEVNAYDLETSKWSTLKVHGEEPTSRMGHTCNILRNFLVIFGGEQKSDHPEMKKREFLNDVYIFDTTNNSWNYIRPNGDIIQGRKNHASATVGKVIIVYGGISLRTGPMSDMWTLNIGSGRWEIASIKNDENKLDMGIYSHTLEPIFHPKRTQITIYKSFEEKITGVSDKGLYLFGGINDKGIAMNTLNILQVDCNPMFWIKPETKGTPPRARYMHTSTYLQNLSMMIVYGGQIETEESDEILDDIFILILQNLTWVQCKTMGVPRPPRCGHCAFNVDNQLYVLGGFNSKGFVSTEIHILNADPKDALEKQRNEELQQTKIEREKELQRKQNEQRENRKLLKENAVKQKKTKPIEDFPLDDDEKFVKEYREKMKELALRQNELHLEYKKLDFKNQVSYLPLPKIGVQLETSSNYNRDYEYITKKYFQEETENYEQQELDDNESILEKELEPNKFGPQWELPKNKIPQEKPHPSPLLTTNNQSFFNDGSNVSNQNSPRQEDSNNQFNFDLPPETYSPSTFNQKQGILSKAWEPNPVQKKADQTNQAPLNQTFK